LVVTKFEAVVVISSLVVCLSFWRPRPPVSLAPDTKLSIFEPV
jgi:hypothetical protein